MDKISIRAFLSCTGKKNRYVSQYGRNMDGYNSLSFVSQSMI